MIDGLIQFHSAIVHFMDNLDDLDVLNKEYN